MIEIDFEKCVYICPFCGCRQSFNHNNCDTHKIGYEKYNGRRKDTETDLEVLYIKCTNHDCKSMTVVARDMVTKKQFDLYPECVYKQFPNYVPQQIREDYTEAVKIKASSQKAAATLLRRCLQGMIRDFYDIRCNSLKLEIDSLKDKVTPLQWQAIDGLRKIGNIGAHMEKDVNLIVDIEEGEVDKLISLIELLIDKWYVARHDEKELYEAITKDAAKKSD